MKQVFLAAHNWDGQCDKIAMVKLTQIGGGTIGLTPIGAISVIPCICVSRYRDPVGKTLN